MEIVKVHDLDEYKKPLNEYFNFMWINSKGINEN